jgi:hypothetical protein
MPTSQTQFFSELAVGHSGPPIPEAKRSYFQARLRNRLFNFILGKFVSEQSKGLTKAILARRIGKPPEVINRWLGAPSNLTLDTVSDLLIGICGEELSPQSEPILNQFPRNYPHSDWITQDDQSTRRAQPPRPGKLALGDEPAQDNVRELLGAK